MAFFQYLAGHREEELAELTITLVGSAIGFLCGSLASSFIGSRKEREAFRAMLAVLLGEAESNLQVLETGFLRYGGAKQGIVNQRFNTTISRQQLGAPGFAKFASVEYLEALGRYVRALELSNEYANVSRVIALQPEESNAQSWTAGLAEVWQRNIEECLQCINKISELSEPQPPQAASRPLAPAPTTTTKPRFSRRY